MTFIDGCCPAWLVQRDRKIMRTVCEELARPLNTDGIHPAGHWPTSPTKAASPPRQGPHPLLDFIIAPKAAGLSLSAAWRRSPGILSLLHDGYAVPRRWCVLAGQRR